MTENLEMLAANYKNGTIKGFNGAIFEYDINYGKLRSAIYEEGQKVENASVDLITEKGAAFNAAQKLAINALQAQNIIIIQFSPDWPNTICEGGTIVYDRIMYYDQNHNLEKIRFIYVSMSCPPPPSDNPAGGSSGDSAAASSSSAEDSGDPGYGGPTSGGMGTGSASAIGNVKAGTRDCVTAIHNSVISVAHINSNINSLFTPTTVSSMIDAVATTMKHRYIIQEEQFPDNSNSNGIIYSQDANTLGTTITFNSDYLDEASDLAVARTMVHELVHEYFVLAGQQYTAGSQGFLDFKEQNNFLFDKNGTLKPDYNNTHHQLMATKYVDGLTSMLTNYATAHNIQVPSSAGNQSLESYCRDLSWGALQGTPAYLSNTSLNKVRIEKNTKNENEKKPGESTANKGC